MEFKTYVSICGMDAHIAFEEKSITEFLWHPSCFHYKLTHVQH
uniref:Uncharacterized protein n=1 Tax=Arundo donax TaxID=35708 RepID=A0A0A9EWN3_ARUDO